MDHLPPALLAHTDTKSEIHAHAYKHGNFRAVEKQWPLTECRVAEGVLPSELRGSMYIRNGGNPLNSDTEQDTPYHWFDGHGQLTGVYFEETSDGKMRALFVNRMLLTDVLIAEQSLHVKMQRPIIPSISTLLGPLRQLHLILYAIFRSIVLVIASHLSHIPVRRISTANTAVMYHDGRALATCESGPPLWITLPELDTIQWWPFADSVSGTAQSLNQSGGIRGMIEEWTTAHPKIDILTGELIAFHSSFVPPYLHYSVIPESSSTRQKILRYPIPIPAPRMMHDFGCSREHAVMIDMALSLDPMNMLRGKPVIHYDPKKSTRFGVFPRRQPDKIEWFETDGCIIFHTANTWTTDRNTVHMTCCRMNSDRIVYASGNLTAPHTANVSSDADECLLYYYEFALNQARNTPICSFPLCTIPFEFPCTSPLTYMEDAKYVYGCSLMNGSFNAALGKAAKIDSLVKVNVAKLVNQSFKYRDRNIRAPMHGLTLSQIHSLQKSRRAGEDTEGVRVFALPSLHYAQECSFVPRAHQRDEDDGFLLTYVFNEAQLDEDGEAKSDARSQLWIIDAWNMRTIVAKIDLPQRVPYGLHGRWFSQQEVRSCRPHPAARSMPKRRQVESWRDQVAAYLQRTFA